VTFSSIIGTDHQSRLAQCNGAYRRGKLLSALVTGCADHNKALLATSINKAPIGLLIDEVFGQRHFLESDSIPAELPPESPLHGMVSKQYNLGSESWQELNLDQLFNSTEFLNGAAD
jgi:chemotaxis signal transduction protein